MARLFVRTKEMERRRVQIQNKMGGAEWNGQLWAAADCDCVQNSDAYILIQNFLMNYFLFIWMNLYSAALTSFLTYYVGAILSAMKGCVRHQLSEGRFCGSITWILSRKSASWGGIRHYCS